MNDYNKKFIFYTLFFATSFLEAKQIETLPPSTESIHLEKLDRIDEPYNWSHLPGSAFKTLSIENISDQTFLNWEPTQSYFLSCETIKTYLKDSTYPILDLYAAWKGIVVTSNDAPPYQGHPLDLLNFAIPCNQEDFEDQFIRLCQELGIQVRRPNVYQKSCYDFSFSQGDWCFFDLKTEQFYLGFDNKTLASSEDIMDDPLLALRTQHQKGQSEIDFKESWKKLALFEILEPASAPTLTRNALPQPKSMEGHDLKPRQDLKIQASYSTLEENLLNHFKSVECINTDPLFDFVSPTFVIQASKQSVEKVRWQISSTANFNFVPTNLDRIQPFNETIVLSEIDQTFLDPLETYYFRIQGYENGVWSDWSQVFEFKVNKPISVEKIELDEIDTHTFEISWERFAPLEKEKIKYYVFGSNSFDFIPQIYCDKQIDHIKDDAIIHEESNNNLVSITKKTKITVSSSFAYYRIIAYQNGKFSNPSSIVHIYASNLYQPRNVLQVYNGSHSFEAKRMLFPSMASHDLLFSSRLTSLREAPTNDMYKLLFSASTLEIINPGYEECPSHISLEIWKEVQPWLMPDNHPCKAILDRLASESRFIKDSASMKMAGFPRADRIGRVSRVCASPHREMPEYYFKVYHDAELSVKYDWKRWVHRCEGAEVIRKCIKQNGLSSRFKVPHKWIYCWPAFGKQLSNSGRYAKKNFILVCENMRICEHKENQRLYKKKVDEKWMDGIYTILQTCGLCDSVYCFNIPFNKDGKICIIDTEFWHKWKVPFERLTKCFASKKKDYWKRLTTSNRIPDGVNSPNNMPRLDRRDRE